VTVTVVPSFPLNKVQKVQSQWKTSGFPFKVVKGPWQPPHLQIEELVEPMTPEGGTRVNTLVFNKLQVTVTVTVSISHLVSHLISKCKLRNLTPEHCKFLLLLATVGSFAN
jgi:hypothetical protein